MMDLPGHLIEGIVEHDPMTDRFTIRTTNQQGATESFDVLKALEKYKGERVRFILVSLKEVAQVAKMVEENGGEEVLGLGTIGGIKR